VGDPAPHRVPAEPSGRRRRWGAPCWILPAGGRRGARRGRLPDPAERRAHHQRHLGKGALRRGGYATVQIPIRDGSVDDRDQTKHHRLRLGGLGGDAGPRDPGGLPRIGESGCLSRGEEAGASQDEEQYGIWSCSQMEHPSPRIRRNVRGSPRPPQAGRQPETGRPLHDRLLRRHRPGRDQAGSEDQAGGPLPRRHPHHLLQRGGQDEGRAEGEAFQHDWR